MVRAGGEEVEGQWIAVGLVVVWLLRLRKSQRRV